MELLQIVDENGTPYTHEIIAEDEEAAFNIWRVLIHEADTNFIPKFERFEAVPAGFLNLGFHCNN